MLLVIGLAIGVSAVAAVAVGHSAGRSDIGAAGSGAPAASGGDQLAREIAALQDTLRRLPNDYPAWASLGLDYVQQAKITVDPSYYPKATAALDRSLAINSTDNDAAMAGEAALKAGEHDFTAALMWAQRGLAINPYNATLYGALNDAQTQLGRYDEAATSAQQMNDLKPGVPAFTRAEYVFELHGDIASATAVMQRALEDSTSSADQAFAHYYLGELAFNAGNPSAALAENEAGLQADPGYAALRQGRARAEVALGMTDAAVRDYATVVSEVPQPQYLVEFGELLASLGRAQEAQAQYAVFGAEVALFQANGITLDTDPTLFYADHGDPAKALAFGEAGLKIRPFIEMEDAYAWALHVNGRDGEALAHERQAMQLGTRNALFFFHAGMIEKALGQNAAATASLKQALASNPHFSPYQEPALRQALTGLGLLAPMVVGLSPAASAHPLGNATVNHYDGLHLYTDHITDLAVEDVAEIPTLQRKAQVDTDGTGSVSDAERSAYAAKQCSSLAATNKIGVNGARLTLTVAGSAYTERPGVIALVVGRLVCDLVARVDLTSTSTVRIDSGWDGGGIGWHEITAVGSGVSLANSPVPAQSVSDTLLRYPNDLPSSPLDQRATILHVVPGAAASSYAAARKIPVAGVAVRKLNKLSNAFNGVVGSRHVTVGVGLLAVVLSMLLGAGHAFLPGHGKTIMAAYLVGRRGRLRDVVTVGATVTVTHTAGVLALGMLISVTAAFAPTAAEQALGVVSGAIVAGVGVVLLVSAVRRTRPKDASVTFGESLAPDGKGAVTSLPVLVSASIGAASEADVLDLDLHRSRQVSAHAHSHAHPHGHGSGSIQDQTHAHRDHESSRPHQFGRAGLVGLGVAGGVVPSPSALLVLLAAVALGRTVFGVVLVLGYGLGMAGALMATGLLLVSLRNRLVRLTLGRRVTRASGLLRLMPVLTALLVLVVGAGLMLRALGGTV